MNTNHLAPFLRRIVNAVKTEIHSAKRLRSESELLRKIDDTQDPRSFSEALADRFGLIAEIKQKSPSMGAMRPENVQNSVRAYQESSIVNAISVLTNSKHFGMKIQNLEEIKEKTDKPLLRKDFIFEEYQIFEARAFGADAILLMANIINDKDRLRELGDLAESLGLDVLYESHNKPEIDLIPREAKIWGVNCRKLDSKAHIWRYTASKAIRNISSLFHLPLTKDLSIRDRSLLLIDEMPHTAIKVAESGITPDKVFSIRELGYNTCLVGNSLLLDQRGIEKALQEFEVAIVAPNSKRAGQMFDQAVAYH